MWTLALLLGSLLLVGCSHTWYRLNTTEEEFKRDSYECYRDAQMIPVTDPLLHGWSQGRVYSRCMDSKGYQKR